LEGGEQFSRKHGNSENTQILSRDHDYCLNSSLVWMLSTIRIEEPFADRSSERYRPQTLRGPRDMVAQQKKEKERMELHFW
jgi:hypothetical protein